MSELFKTIPKSVPSKKTDDYKESFQTTIRAVGGEWNIYQMNANPSHINRKRLSKKEKIKEYKIRENIKSPNDHWYNLKLELHCNKLKWIHPKHKTVIGIPYVLKISSSKLNM